MYVSDNPLLIVWMCDEVVDDSLGALKFIHHSFNVSKVIEKLLIALFADDILYFNKDFGNAIFSCNEIGIANTDLNNINLGVTNYDKYDPSTINDIRLLVLPIKFDKYL